MMLSILRFLPEARFHVLCLDDTAHWMVRERMLQVQAIRLAELEEFDRALAAVKPRRTMIEYYFTCTPCLPRYILSRETDADIVTYLDADLFFYRSPEEVFAVIGDASIAITPHRFSPDLADRVRYGRFNVAWVSWRRDAEGMRCLEDYRRDCLDWCHDRVEGDRFADQKYLDKWPDSYRGVCVLAGKGINLALWNVEGGTFLKTPDAYLVDGEPLVFYHFHGVKHVGPGLWDTRHAEYRVEKNLSFLIEELYNPYLNILESTFNTFAGRYGLAVPGDRRFGSAAIALPAVPATAPRLYFGQPDIEVAAGWSKINAGAGERNDFAGMANILCGIADDSVSDIYCCYVLDHLGFRTELPVILGEMRRVLAPGGSCRISVPDIDALARLLIDEKMNQEQKLFLMAHFYGGQENEHDFRKVGFNHEILLYFLTMAGFKEARRVETFGLFQDNSVLTRFGTPISLNVEARK